MVSTQEVTAGRCRILHATAAPKRNTMEAFLQGCELRQPFGSLRRADFFCLQAAARRSSSARKEPGVAQRVVAACVAARRLPDMARERDAEAARRAIAHAFADL